MITPSFGLTATERVLPRLALDFTTALLDSRITFTRSTGASNPATFINSSGVITAATNNQPRFDHDPVTLACKGLLIEETRTNVLLNSDLLSTQTVTVTAAARTLSFYGTGQIVLSGAASATVTGTGAYPTRTTYTFTPSAGSLTLTVTGTVQYAQLEAGAFVTSYIPTTSAALTRNADVAVMTGTNFSDWYNGTAGTILAQAAQPSLFAASKSVLSLIEVGASRRISLYRQAAGTANGILSFNSGGSQQIFTGQSVNASGWKHALAYSGTALNYASNGVMSGTTATMGFDPADIDELRLGNNINGGNEYLNGWLAKVQYWPQRLTNAEMQAFTKV